jgi:hypothetical protein
MLPSNIEQVLFEVIFSSSNTLQVAEDKPIKRQQYELQKLQGQALTGICVGVIFLFLFSLGVLRNAHTYHEGVKWKL